MPVALLSTGLVLLGIGVASLGYSWVLWRMAHGLERQELLPRRFTNFLGFDSILGMVSGVGFVMVGLAVLVVAGINAIAR